VVEFVEQNLRMLCEWRNIEILEMNLKEDHIHMILSMPLNSIDFGKTKLLPISSSKMTKEAI